MLLFLECFLLFIIQKFIARFKYFYILSLQNHKHCSQSDQAYFCGLWIKLFNLLVHLQR